MTPAWPNDLVGFAAEKGRELDLEELREAFEFPPYELRLWRAQTEVIADYFDEDGVHVSNFAITFGPDGEVGWTSAWGRELGQGFYTHLMRWAVTQPVVYQWPPTQEARDFYLSTGWKDTHEPTRIELDKKAAKKWLKGR